jgi:hypothetical protein
MFTEIVIQKLTPFQNLSVHFNYFSSVIYRQIGTLKKYGTQNFDRKGIIAKLFRMKEKFTGKLFCCFFEELKSTSIVFVCNCKSSGFVVQYSLSRSGFEHTRPLSLT